MYNSILLYCYNNEKINTKFPQLIYKRKNCVNEDSNIS